MESGKKSHFENKHFTIGQVASITGISRDRLRYYEEKGILFPSQEEENNYRNYSMADIDMILSIEFYRSMDLSMKEISQIWNSHTPKDVIGILAQKENEIFSKLNELQGYLNNIKKGMEACKVIDENLNKFLVKEMPPFEILGEFSDYRAYSEYEKLHNRRGELGGKSIVNSMKRMITISNNEIVENKMLITRNRCNLDGSTNIVAFDKCLYTVVEDGLKNGDITEEMCQKSLKWGEENNLKFEGSVFISIILVMNDANTMKSYLEIYAPIL
jgi:DNA-binding transcriptional MerR regulator